MSEIRCGPERAIAGIWLATEIIRLDQYRVRLASEQSNFGAIKLSHRIVVLDDARALKREGRSINESVNEYA